MYTNIIENAKNDLKKIQAIQGQWQAERHPTSVPRVRTNIWYCLAGWAGWTCLLRAGWDLLVSLPSLGMWHKRQLRWPCVQVSVCIPHAWWGWGWGLAVDRAGAPPSDLGTACVDLILAAPVGGTFG